MDHALCGRNIADRRRYDRCSSGTCGHDPVVIARSHGGQDAGRSRLSRNDHRNHGVECRRRSVLAFGHRLSRDGTVVRSQRLHLDLFQEPEACTARDRSRAWIRSRLRTRRHLARSRGSRLYAGCHCPAAVHASVRMARRNPRLSARSRRERSGSWRRACGGSGNFHRRIYLSRDRNPRLHPFGRACRCIGGNISCSTTNRGSGMTSIDTTPDTSESTRLYDVARRYFPGGVSSPVRAFNGVGGSPRFIVSGKGAYVTDADGNRLVDYLLAYGPHILGHAPQVVLDAIIETASQGTSFGAPSTHEIELAEAIQQFVPSMQVMRFVTSGTEAVMSAIRLARA